MPFSIFREALVVRHDSAVSAGLVVSEGTIVPDYQRERDGEHSLTGTGLAGRGGNRCQFARPTNPAKVNLSPRPEGSLYCGCSFWPFCPCAY
jgi:hypothetical protein